MNKPLKILFFTNALVLLAGGMLGPIYALFVDEIGGDLLDASMAGAAFSLAAGLTVILFGKLSDRVKENELIIVCGYLLVGTGFLAYIFVHDVWMIVLIQALIGLGEAMYVAPFDSLYSKYLDKNQEGKQWSYWESMLHFTSAIGAVVGGFVVVHYGFPLLFIIMTILCYASGLYIYFLKTL